LSSENFNGRDYVGELGIDDRIIIKYALKKYSGSVWTGFSRLRVGTIGGLL
jgi:hypothetical protein